MNCTRKGLSLHKLGYTEESDLCASWCGNRSKALGIKGSEKLKSGGAQFSLHANGGNGAAVSMCTRTARDIPKIQGRATERASKDNGNPRNENSSPFLKILDTPKRLYLAPHPVFLDSESSRDNTRYQASPGTDAHHADANHLISFRCRTRSRRDDFSAKHALRTKSTLLDLLHNP